MCYFKGMKIKGALIVPKYQFSGVQKDKVYEAIHIETHGDIIVSWFYDDEGFLTYTTSIEHLFDIYYQV